jgi:hypothetical protein
MLLYFVLLLTFLLPVPAVLLLMTSGEVPIVPAAPVIYDFNGIPARIGLPACWIHYFASFPAFAGVHNVLAVLLLLSFLLLLAFLLL